MKENSNEFDKICINSETLDGRVRDGLVTHSCWAPSNR